MIKSIYDLELHESMRLQNDYSAGFNTRVTSVPGGWIYTMHTRDYISSVFVPYNEDYYNYMKEKQDE